MTRGHLPDGLAAVAAAAPLRAQTGRRVPVIGAGVAGPAADRRPVTAGRKLTVIKARLRTRGRVRTSRLWPDLPVKTGASRVHGITGDPPSALADQAGARGRPTSRGKSRSPDRQTATDDPGTGSLNKSRLCLDPVGRPLDMDWIDCPGPRDGHRAERVGPAPATVAPVLPGFNAGTPAIEIDAPENAATRSAGLQVRCAMFGTGLAAPVGGQVTRRPQDGLACGSSAFGAVRTSAGNRRAFGGTDWGGRRVFSGEATAADRPGTMRGVVLTGLAAAAALGVQR